MENLPKPYRWIHSVLKNRSPSKKSWRKNRAPEPILSTVPGTVRWWFLAKFQRNSRLKIDQGVDRQIWRVAESKNSNSPRNKNYTLIKKETKNYYFLIYFSIFHSFPSGKSTCVACFFSASEISWFNSSFFRQYFLGKSDRFVSRYLCFLFCGRVAKSYFRAALPRVQKQLRHSHIYFAARPQQKNAYMNTLQHNIKNVQKKEK